LSNSKNCILSNVCSLVNSEACTRFCPHFIATDARLKSANVPQNYRLLTISNSPIRASEPGVYKTLDAYVKTFKRALDASEGHAAEPIKSVYLYSPTPGNGKTTTAIALLHEYLIRHYVGSLQRGRQPEQVPVYFLDVNEFQTLFNEFNRNNVPADVAETASREYYHRYHKAKVTPFVVLDDIGVRSASEAFRGDLHSIINHRITNGLPSVYTSNLPIEELVRVFDARLYDRVRDMCIVLPFGGESKRGLRR
jgi:DNA replication protein DnaC